MLTLRRRGADNVMIESNERNFRVKLVGHCVPLQNDAKHAAELVSQAAELTRNWAACQVTDLSPQIELDIVY